MDIRELDLQWLRGLFGVVLQEPVLFDATVFENIRMGRVNATPADVEAAARLADAYEFITKLPHVSRVDFFAHTDIS